MFLKPFAAKRDLTLWLDPKTGRAVWPNGNLHTHAIPETGLRLDMILQLAKYVDATRVMLVGEQLERAVFMQVVEGWEHLNHHLHDKTPAYRYAQGELHVEVRLASEWFGSGEYNPLDAARAWDALERSLKASGKSPVWLRRGPAATGKEMWISVMNGNIPDPLDEDTQELIRSWAPQHRIQLLPPETPTMDGFHVIDGRFMYAALTKGLGTGPVELMRGVDARAYFEKNPYARARYYVKWKQPQRWGKISVLMSKNPDGLSWDWGTSGECWADAAEIKLAADMGYTLDFKEGILFTAGRPLDTWTDRLVRARDAAAQLDESETVRDMVRGALRSILLYGIGSFHSRGNSQTTLTASAMNRPEGDGWGAPSETETGMWLWERVNPPRNARAAGTQHPEFSAQIWGRAHAHILDGPVGGGKRGGLLSTPEKTIVAIYGDALMTTEKPWWVEYDDGKVGRLRLKGSINEETPWPIDRAARDELVRRAG